MKKILKPTIAVLIAVMLVAAMVVTSCATARGRGNVSWDESHDVIIIGAGVSGYVTYLSIMQAARDAGQNLDVLFIEQMPEAGGITNTAGSARFNNMRLWHDWTPAARRSAYSQWMEGALVGVGGFHPDNDPATSWTVTDDRRLNLAYGPVARAPYPDFQILEPVFRSIRDAWRFLFTQFGGTFDENIVNGPGAFDGNNLIRTQVGIMVGRSDPQNSTGRQYMQALQMAGNRLGGQQHLRVNHKAVELHQTRNANGQYVGAGISLIDNRGMRRNHQGKVIVFATGSFAQNMDMKKEFGAANSYRNAIGLEHFTLINPSPGAFIGADGSGINILRDSALPRPAAVHVSGFGVPHGARPHIDLHVLQRTAPMGVQDYRILWFSGTIFDSDLSNQFGSVLVNSRGARTLNEASLAAGNPKGSHHMLTENLFPYWRVFSSHAGNDTPVIQGALSALESAVAFTRGTRGTQTDRNRVGELVVSAPSLAELASKMFPADAAARNAFLSTVTAYDGWVAANTGNDPHAGNFFPAGSGKTLANAAGVRFNDAPGRTFYAVQWYPFGFDTAGGVRTNENAQVIATDGAAIPNVFAVGGVSNRHYIGETYVTGSSLTLYPTMAIRAAAQVMQELRN
jgi:predicted small secreted protein